MPFNLSSFQDLGMFIRLALPSALMMLFEWGAFELLTLFCGLIGVAPQAAQNVISNCLGFMFMLSLGLGSAVASTMGNELGRQNVNQVIKWWRANLLVGVSLVLVQCLTFFFLSKHICAHFTPLKSVQDQFDKVVPIITIACFFDQMQGFL